jgi:hypothetical protein
VIGFHSSGNGTGEPEVDATVRAIPIRVQPASPDPAPAYRVNLDQPAGALRQRRHVIGRAKEATLPVVLPVGYTRDERYLLVVGGGADGRGGEPLS